MKTLTQVFTSIEERKKDIDVISTGFPEIDDTLDGGFFKKEIITIGGRTGSGKSFMASTLFYNFAKQGFKTAYFSLEISNEMVVSRLIGSLSNIQPTHVMLRKLDEQTQEKIFWAKSEIGVYEECMFFYDDLFKYEEIKKEIEENEFDIVIIDFIQNVVGKGKEEYDRLSYLAHEFQMLASKQNVCMIIISQLSNAVSRDRREDIIEFKGSGEIGVVSDLGFYIMKDKKVHDRFSLQLRKSRRSITGAEFYFAHLSPGGVITPAIKEDVIYVE